MKIDTVAQMIRIEPKSFVLTVRDGVGIPEDWKRTVRPTTYILESRHLWPWTKRRKVAIRYGSRPAWAAIWHDEGREFYVPRDLRKILKGRYVVLSGPHSDDEIQ